MSPNTAVIADMVARVRADTSDFEKGMNRTDSRLARGVKTMAKLGAAGGTAAAAGILKAGMAYEDTLNMFQAVTDASGREMKKVGKTAKALGNDIEIPGASAADAAEAMTALSKAGFSVKDSMGAAKGVLQAAAAAEMDAASAAEMIGQQLSAFSLKATDASKVSDLLAGAAAAAQGEVTDMGQAMSQVGAIASKSGQSIEDTTTAIGLMANNGILGSDAGTSLKSVLLALGNPSKKAAALMDDLGFSAYDANGKMKSLPDIIGSLQKSMKGLTDQERDAALGTMFGSDGSRAVSIFLKEGTAGFDKMSKAVTKSGAAAKIAGAQTKGLRGAWAAVINTLETGAVTAYEKVSGPLTQGLVGFSDKLAAAGPAMSRAWEAVGPSLGDAAKSVLNLVEAAGPLAATIGKTLVVAFVLLLETVTPLIQALTPVVGFFAQHEKVTLSLAAAIGALMLVNKAHATWMAVQGIAGLVAWTKSLSAVRGATLLWAGASKAATAASLGTRLGLAALAIQTTATTAATTVATAASRLLSVGLRAVGFAVRFALGPIGLIITAIGVTAYVIRKLWKENETFRRVVTGAWNSVKNAVGKVVGWFKSAIPAAFRAVKWAFLNMTPVGQVIKNFDKIVAGAKSIKTKITGFFKGIGGWLVGAGKRLIGGLIDGIKDMLPDVGGAMGSIAKKIKGFLPGSPVAEGPLTSWNNGGAGKRLVRMLAAGLSDTGPVESAMSSLASAASGSFNPAVAGGYSTGTTGAGRSGAGSAHGSTVNNVVNNTFNIAAGTTAADASAIKSAILEALTEVDDSANSYGGHR